MISIFVATTRSATAQALAGDSIGEHALYTATIEMKKGYISGLCLVVAANDTIKASLFNEFGIAAVDFTYAVRSDKVQLLRVAPFLDKWYIRRVLRKDLRQLLHTLRPSGGEYHNTRYGIHYRLTALDDDPQ